LQLSSRLSELSLVPGDAAGADGGAARRGVLTRLDLHGALLTAADLPCLAAASPALTYLDLSYCGDVEVRVRFGDVVRCGDAVVVAILSGCKVAARAWRVPPAAVFRSALHSTGVFSWVAPVAQKVEHPVFHRGGVGSYPTRSNFSGQVTPSN
jgi:hypothetical protein